jgi:hypothetical protein
MRRGEGEDVGRCNQKVPGSGSSSSSSNEVAGFLQLSDASFRQIAPSLPRHKHPCMGYRYLRSELLEWLVSQGNGGRVSSPPPAKPHEPTGKTEKKAKRKRV